MDLNRYSRELRESFDVRQYPLSRECGVPEKKISQFENGERSLTDPELAALLEGVRAIVRRRTNRAMGFLTQDAGAVAVGA